MNNLDIERIKTDISIVDLVGRQYTLKRHSHNSLTPVKSKGEYDGTLVVYPDNNSWTWFTSGGGGQSGKHGGGSVIDWYMFVNGCNARTAIRELRHSLNGGELRSASPVVRSSSKTKPQRVQDDDWRHKAKQKVALAQNHLRNRKAAGVEYLVEKRHLDINTCIQCGVGFDPHVYYSKADNDQWMTAAGIMFPYYSIDGEIIGIRYRWLEKIGGQKQFAKGDSNFKGAEFLLYHLMQRGLGSNVLFVVEGELNALSIMQCEYDAVSIGSEQAGISDNLIAFATGYDHVVVWTDGGKAAAAYAEQLSGIAVKSPEIGVTNNDTGETEIKERDANDLLGMQCLESLIEKIVPDAIKFEIAPQPTDTFPLPPAPERWLWSTFDTPTEAEEFAAMKRTKTPYTWIVDGCTATAYKVTI